MLPNFFLPPLIGNSKTIEGGYCGEELGAWTGLCVVEAIGMVLEVEQALLVRPRLAAAGRREAVGQRRQRAERETARERCRACRARQDRL